MIIAECSDPSHLFCLKYDSRYMKLSPHSPPRPPQKINYKVLNQSMDDMIKGDFSRFKHITYEGDIQKACEHKWAELKEFHGEYFRKHGYLPVRYNKSTDDYEVDIPPAGRPRAKKPKSIVLNVRLDENTNNQLDNYCKTNNVNASAAVRTALQQLFSNEK